MSELQDIAAENACLAGIYQFGTSAYFDVSDLISDSTFTDSTNQIIYKCFQYLFDIKKLEKLDNASIVSAANELGFSWAFNSKEEYNKIQEILNTHILLDSIRVWAAKIRKLEIARLLQQQLVESKKQLGDISGDEPIEQILGIVENPIFDFTKLISSPGDDTKHISDGLFDYLKYLEENPVENVGVGTGYKYYDKAIGGGLRRKTVNLIGARAKKGKSFLAINIGMYVSGHLQIPVLYLDTEMDMTTNWHRILSNITYRVYKNGAVEINDIETGKYAQNQDSKNKITDAAKKACKTKFFYRNVSGKPFEEILSIMRRWLVKDVKMDSNGNTNHCLIIFDYLKLMNEEGLNHMAEYQKLGFMMVSMHNFAVKHDVPILTFVQLNRDGISREDTDVISQSDRILWIVSNFSIYKDKSDVEIAEDGGEKFGNRKLMTLAARHGEGLPLGDYINYVFTGKYGYIQEGETKNNLKAKQSSQSNLVNMSIDESIPIDNAAKID